MRRFVAVYALLALAPAPAWAQLALVDDPAVGRVQFIFRGGSFVDNEGVENGVNCLEEASTTVVSESDLPSRPTLVRAILTVSGSLFGDDGPDFVNPNVELLSTPNLDYTDPADRPFIENAARADADRQVLFTFPGASAPVELSALTSEVDAFNRPVEAETPGNVAYFTTRFDVTDLLRDIPTLAGTYEVSGLTADVCFGREASCALGETCGGVSAIHSNAAASFSLLLIVESASLPLRTVAAFEGINLLEAGQDTLTLTSPTPFSDPAAGRLAFYALEGDLPISEAAPMSEPCESAEFIEVDGDTDPNIDGLCLSDDDNPVGNLFNSTINVLPEDPLITPVCTSAEPIECCVGDGLCGTTGVDIDRFNISEALTPGEDELRITIGTGTDLVVLNTVVFEADLFEPVLNVDSQVRVLDVNALGQVQLGAPITYVIAVSNTGNVDATEVSVRMSVPPRVSDFELLAVPEGATNTSAPQSGVNGTGLINITELTVPAGEIAAITFRVTTDCDALGVVLRPSAAIGTTTFPSFDVLAEPVTVVGPGVGLCDGIDPNGPFQGDDEVPLPPRELRSGAGCNGISGVSLVLVLALLLLIRRRRT